MEEVDAAESSSGRTVENAEHFYRQSLPCKVRARKGRSTGFENVPQSPFRCNKFQKLVTGSPACKLPGPISGRGTRMLFRVPRRCCPFRPHSQLFDSQTDIKCSVERAEERCHWKLTNFFLLSRSERFLGIEKGTNDGCGQHDKALCHRMANH